VRSNRFKVHQALTITLPVVSLKPFLDSQDQQLLGALLDSYQRMLTATADCNAGLCAQSAGDLAANLRLLEQSITAQSLPSEVLNVQQNAERHLHAWHDRTQDYLRQKASEMKDLMVLVAKTAESVGERDQKHNRNLKGLTDRLKDIAELEDVTRLRASLMASVEEMSKTVEQMTRDTEQTRRALEVELANYRSRLQQTEQAAMMDPLTGLANRRRLESDLNLRIRRSQPFALLLVDLNGFKAINDTYGHLAGDQILRQFGSELKQICHQSDLVGRWGGDEFLVLLNGQLSQAEAAVQRIEQWVWGTYPIKVEPGTPSIKVEVTASIGIGIWTAGMSAESLLQQADAAMYKRKVR
jgi:diguanylate cyclase (GGDEF)-like protein